MSSGTSVLGDAVGTVSLTHSDGRPGTCIAWEDRTDVSAICAGIRFGIQRQPHSLVSPPLSLPRQHARARAGNSASASGIDHAIRARWVSILAGPEGDAALLSRARIRRCRLASLVPRPPAGPAAACRYGYGWEGKEIQSAFCLWRGQLIDHKGLGNCGPEMDMHVACTSSCTVRDFQFCRPSYCSSHCRLHLAACSLFSDLWAPIE